MRRLTIGVDASRAWSRRPTGTELYASRLIERLVALGGHDYRLYLRAPADVALPSGAQARVMPAPRLWTHTRLAMEMLRQPPDVLFVPAHVLPWRLPSASVVTVHDLGYLRFPSAHTRFARLYLDLTTRRHVQRATRLLADSRSTRDDLVSEYGADESRIDVVHLGVDAEMHPAGTDGIAAARLAVGLLPDTPYVLHVGTLQPRKNLARLVDAWAVVAGRYPSHVLVLAGGGGWGDHDPADQARALGLAERVRVVGYVPRRYLAGLYSGADLLAHPSLYEGFGLTALEAMACGTPVLASQTSSLPEVVGDAGALVDPTSVPDLARAIDGLLAAPGVRRAMAARGLERAAEFSWDRCARATRTALERAAMGSV